MPVTHDVDRDVHKHGYRGEVVIKFPCEVMMKHRCSCIQLLFNLQ